MDRSLKSGANSTRSKRFALECGPCISRSVWSPSGLPALCVQGFKARNFLSGNSLPATKKWKKRKRWQMLAAQQFHPGFFALHLTETRFHLTPAPLRRDQVDDEFTWAKRHLQVSGWPGNKKTKPNQPV